MKTLAEISSVIVRVGGEPPIGWLPPEAVPLPTPVREIELMVAILDNEGDGCVFEYESPDGSYRGDTWHRSVEEAKRAARDWYGIAEDAWTTP